MNGLVLLIPAALLLGLGGLAAFFWALRSGQFDDLDGAAMRVLIDNESDTSVSPASSTVAAQDNGDEPRSE